MVTDGPFKLRGGARSERRMRGNRCFSVSTLGGSKTPHHNSRLQNQMPNKAQIVQIVVLALVCLSDHMQNHAKFKWHNERYLFKGREIQALILWYQKNRGVINPGVSFP